MKHANQPRTSILQEHSNNKLKYLKMVVCGDGVKVGMEEGVNQGKRETKGDSILCELKSLLS